MMRRDYEAVARRIRAEIGATGACAANSETTEKSGVSGVCGSSERDLIGDAKLRIVVDALWDGLREQGISWVGFYCFHPGKPADQAMTLGPSRDTPACSPIGLHGACGQAFTSRRPLIVRDVAELGDGYVACDPRDRSEIILPCFAGSDAGATCWGVLDLDSHELAAFDETDAKGLAIALQAAGIGVR
jgi:putative methionine-R-sulfoxide reductase with GAF domain